MTELERIADQYRRAFDGEAWHGPALLQLLSDITAEQAAARPLANAHSIWELVLHIAAWEGACRRRLEGDVAQLDDQENFPPVTEISDEAWARARQHLLATHRELLDAIARVDAGQLDRPVIESTEIPFSSVYVTLHGGVQHDLYHAGQIALLKKALESQQRGAHS